MHGFQLWANLPSSLKMTAPRYQDVQATRHSRGHRRRRHARAGRLRRLLGQARPGGRHRRRSALSRRVGPAGQAQDAAGRDATATRSPTCSRAPARSATRPQPFGVLTEKDDRDGETAGPRADRQPIAGAVRPRRRGHGAGGRRRASASCWSRASRSRSRSRGTGRS